MKTHGGVKAFLNAFLAPDYMNVKGNLHAQADLSLGKKPPVHFE
jgi:hypothetical protein